MRADQDCLCIADLAVADFDAFDLMEPPQE